MAKALPLFALLVAPALAACLAPGEPAMPANGPPSAAQADRAVSLADATMVSFDGVEIAYSVWKPDDATAQAPVPIVLLFHGILGTVADGETLALRIERQNR